MDAVHPRVLGYLGRALSLELTAVQQYMTQAALVSVWGDQDSAQWFREESVSEMRHAEAIVHRLIALGSAPAASQLLPAAHAPDLVGLLRADLVLEDQLLNLYAEAVRFCLLIGDGEQEGFFRQLWREEQQHGEVLAAWLGRLQHPHGALHERAMF
ncbi:MAG: ferritin-like domain-containing protein [Chitinophagaceae bacterium]|nr:ferritin-like domain-containing protein [Chitinophagaceae bacterium]